MNETAVVRSVKLVAESLAVRFSANMVPVQIASGSLVCAQILELRVCCVPRWLFITICIKYSGLNLFIGFW